jgi:hypothetical protein
MPAAPRATVKAVLSQLADLAAEESKKAKTEADLISEVSRLQRELSGRAIDPQELARAEQRGYERAVQEFQTGWEPVKSALAQAGKAVQSAVDLSVFQAPGETCVGLSDPVPVSVSTRVVPSGGEIRDVSSNGHDLQAGAKRLLAAVIDFPNGMTEGHWRSQAALRKSGSYSTYKSALKSRNLIRIENGMVYPTDQAYGFLRVLRQRPQTTEQVLSIWDTKLASGASRMLRLLISKGAMSRDELSSQAGVTGGSFSTYLSSLRSANLVVKDSEGRIAANRVTLCLR